MLTEAFAPVGRRRGAAGTADAPTGMVPAVNAAVNRRLAVPTVVFVPPGTALRTLADAGFESNDRISSTVTSGATGEW